MSEYNEFMFNYTNRIPIAEIEKKVSEIKKEEEKESSKKIYSPYTKVSSKGKSKSKTIILVLIGIFLVIMAIVVLLVVKNKVDNQNFVGFNMLKGVNFYEFTK